MGEKAAIFIFLLLQIFYALSNLSKHSKIEAENGQGGMSNKKNGRNSEDLDIKLPIGTIVTDKKQTQFLK